MTELPKYKCHKEVQASKILGIVGYPVLSLRLECGEVIKAGDTWMSKHKPVMGGYFVRYEDGYESFSPAKAFEEGYALMPSGTNKLIIEDYTPNYDEMPFQLSLGQIRELVTGIIREEIHKALNLDQV